MYFKFAEIEIPELSDNHPEAYNYMITHKPTGMWYFGMHTLKENESIYDGAYLNSSTDKSFLELLETRPEEFKLEILNTGSTREMLNLENETLIEFDAKNNPKSWNKSNGFRYKTEELPRLDLIDKLAADAYNPNSDLERKNEKVDEIYEDITRLQVRFNTDFSTKKISEYRNEMNSNNSTKGFTLTMVRRGNRRILVGGNHTLEAAKRSRCQNIDVVYIDEDLTIEEMNALGNALNRRIEIQRIATSIEDCGSDLVNLYLDGKIKDDEFKDQFSTDYIKITGGFKGHDITKVRKFAKDNIKEIQSWKKDKKWIAWSSDKRKIEKANRAKAQTTDKILCVTQSSSFRTDRVIEEWIKDADARKEAGLEPRPNIKILMHYKNMQSQTDYTSREDQKTHTRIITNFLKGEGIKDPIVHYEDLPLWEDKVS